MVCALVADCNYCIKLQERFNRVSAVDYCYAMRVLAHLIYVYAFALEHTVILRITLHRPRAAIISMLTLSMVSQLRFICKRHSKMFR